MRFAPYLRDSSYPSSDPTEDGDAVGLGEQGRVDNKFHSHWLLFVWLLTLSHLINVEGAQGYILGPPLFFYTQGRVLITLKTRHHITSSKLSHSFLFYLG